MAEPDRNPLRRLMALPNESRTKTVLVAFLVSAICAALVSGATVLLRPIQAANRAAEEQARIAATAFCCRRAKGTPGLPAVASRGWVARRSQRAPSDALSSGGRSAISRCASA